MTELGEERIVGESGQEVRVARIVEPTINDLGYRLVRIKLSSMNGLTLQIMAERPDGSMTVNDCEEISKAISPVLDFEDPIDKAYNLEVSSPGIDRPLVRLSDFVRWTGHVAKVETRGLIGGRKRFRGRIEAVSGSMLELRRDDAAKGEEDRFSVPLGEIAEFRGF